MHVLPTLVLLIVPHLYVNHEGASGIVQRWKPHLLPGTRIAVGIDVRSYLRARAFLKETRKNAIGLSNHGHLFLLHTPDANGTANLTHILWKTNSNYYAKKAAAVNLVEWYETVSSGELNVDDLRVEDRLFF